MVMEDLIYKLQLIFKGTLLILGILIVLYMCISITCELIRERKRRKIIRDFRLENLEEIFFNPNNNQEDDDEND